MTVLNPIPEQLNFGEIQQFEGLALLPIFNKASSGTFDYITLDQAISQNLIQITEVSESGSVPELLLENNGPSPVLLMDGEELVGKAKSGFESFGASAS